MPKQILVRHLVHVVEIVRRLAQRGILAENSKAFVFHIFAPDKNLFDDTVIACNLAILFNLYFQHRCRILNNFPLGATTKVEIFAGVGPKILIWVSERGEQAFKLLCNHLLFRQFQLVLCHHNCLKIMVFDRHHLNFYMLCSAVHAVIEAFSGTITLPAVEDAIHAIELLTTVVAALKYIVRVNCVTHFMHIFAEDFLLW